MQKIFEKNSKMKSFTLPPTVLNRFIPFYVSVNETFIVPDIQSLPYVRSYFMDSRIIYDIAELPFYVGSVSILSQVITRAEDLIL